MHEPNLEIPNLNDCDRAEVIVEHLKDHLREMEGLLGDEMTTHLLDHLGKLKADLDVRKCPS